MFWFGDKTMDESKLKRSKKHWNIIKRGRGGPERKQVSYEVKHCKKYFELVRRHQGKTFGRIKDALMLKMQAL